jgi:hypothetical protein
MPEAPKTFEEGMRLKEKARHEKSMFIAGLSPEGVAELERQHKLALGKANKRNMTIRRYEGFDK